MKMAALFLLLTLTLASSVATTELCSRCKCTTPVPTRNNFDCSHLDFLEVPSDFTWPPPVNITDDSSPLPTTLDFSYNKMAAVDQMPAAWESVTEMSFRRNNVSDIAESAFINLKQLKKLDLSHNIITSDVIRADVFRGDYDNVRYEPLSITVLDLGFNEIHSLNPRAFEHLPDLMELRLNNNPLMVVDTATEMALALPTSLLILNLANTGLSDLPDTLMQGIKRIEELYLNGNSFRSVPESLASVGTSLMKLNLNDNPMTSLNEDSFLGLLNLRQLNISGCEHLVEILPATFSTLVKLEALHLSFNFNLSYIDKDAFRGLKEHWRITELYMHHDALTSLSPDLLPWDQLQVVDLQENPWRCDCELQWMTSHFAQRIATLDPEHVVNLRCHEPFQLRGLQIITLNTNSSNAIIDCGSTINFRPPRLPRHTATSSIFITVISVLTLTVCACAVVLLVSKKLWQLCGSGPRFVLLKDVRYTRE